MHRHLAVAFPPKLVYRDHERGVCAYILRRQQLAQVARPRLLAAREAVCDHGRSLRVATGLQDYVLTDEMSAEEQLERFQPRVSGALTLVPDAQSLRRRS